jgi:hypothetical protein
MKNHVTRKVMAIAELPATLGELRQHVLLPLIGNPLFSEAEQLRANHFVHESEDIARLIRWGTNVLVEIISRQAEAARQRRYFATRATLGQLLPTGFRCHIARLCPPAPTCVANAFFPDRSDRQADTFDRLVAASFQPADTLTVANLLSR